MSTRAAGTPGTVVRRCVIGLVAAGCAGALVVGVGTAQRASADVTAVDLDGAASYAVLASGTVTATARPSVTGDVGGSRATGLDGRVTGAVETGGSTAQALADLGAADDAVASRAVTTALTAVTGTLLPGTYGIDGSIDVPGALTLDAGGDPDATFIIKTDAELTTGAATAIRLAGGARACNVFWLAGGSATVEGTVVGTVFGRAGITARDGAAVTGRLMARSGAVRLDGATVTVPTDCDGAAGPVPVVPRPPGTGLTAPDLPGGADPDRAGPSSGDGALRTRWGTGSDGGARDTGGGRAGGSADGRSASTGRSGGSDGDDSSGDDPSGDDPSGNARAGRSGGDGPAGDGPATDDTSGRAADPAPGPAARREPQDDRPAGRAVVTTPPATVEGRSELGDRLVGGLLGAAGTG